MKITSGIINRTKRLAETSDYYPFKLGAVIIKNGNIIAEGKNHTGYKKNIKDEYRFVNSFVHAEVDALSKLSKKEAKGATLFVLRVNPGNTERLFEAKPCEYCQKMISDYGIKRVFATTIDGSIKEYKVVQGKKEKAIKNVKKKEFGYTNKFLIGFN